MAKNKKTKADDVPAVREVLYPEPTATMATGDAALTSEQAKGLLGWQEVTDEDKDRKDLPEPLLVDYNGKKIRCLNNVTNRPLYTGTVEAYVQEMLMRRWRFNGEPVIIGKTALVLNGQHQLISLVLAEQARENDTTGHWSKYWDVPVTIDKMLVFGIDEDDVTVDTMDTCKPRSLADVIYRSPHFAKMKSSDRQKVSRVLEAAVKVLWQRTGAKDSEWNARMTHAEALDFISRHERVLKAARHVYEEDGSNRAIAKYIAPGTAAAILYLMGASSSDPASYRKASPPAEKRLKWDRWDKAEEFWVMLAGGAPEMKGVRFALGALADPDTGSQGSMAEKMVVLGKAWDLFVAGKEMKESELRPKYHTDEDGVCHLTDEVDFGGIDVGLKKKEAAKKEDGEADEGEEEDTTPPTPEEIEQRKADIRKEKANKLLDSRKQKKAKKEEEAPVQPAMAGDEGDGGNEGEEAPAMNGTAHEEGETGGEDSAADRVNRILNKRPVLGAGE